MMLALNFTAGLFLKLLHRQCDFRYYKSRSANYMKLF